MTTTHIRPLIEVLRREAYLTRLSFSLEDLPRGRRRAIYRDLRTELTAAAGDIGMAAAVRDLGPASALAHAYRDAEGRPLPRWTLGALVAGSVAILWVLTTLTYAMGLLDAAGSARGPGTAATTTTGTFLWNDIRTSSSAAALSVESTGPGFLVMIAVCAVVAFTVARGWRSWRR